MSMGIRSATVEKTPEEVFKPLVDADPITKPLNVMVTVVEAAIAAVAVVITMTFDDGVEEVPVQAPLINTVGVATELKNPVG
jgi:hypothetical protein